MLKKNGKNAYEIELPKDYGVSPTFNVPDLSPFYNHDDETNKNLRTSLFQPGEIDMGVSNLLQYVRMDHYKFRFAFPFVQFTLLQTSLSFSLHSYESFKFNTVRILFFSFYFLCFPFIFCVFIKSV